jgi:hypothetical protein
MPALMLLDIEMNFSIGPSPMIWSKLADVDAGFSML